MHFKISTESLLQWYSFLRHVCLNYFENKDYQLGGIEHVVEIDESVFSQRKYNREKMIKEKWCFWGEERGGRVDTISELSFIEMVKDRTVKTLLTLIIKYIKPGSIMVNDG